MSTRSPHEAVNLADKLARFDEHWSPRAVATFNGHDVMVVKVKGKFVWHHHDDTDDFFCSRSSDKRWGQLVRLAQATNAATMEVA